eukprot:3938081-Rhodomonas_salina.1
MAAGAGAGDPRDAPCQLRHQLCLDELLRNAQQQIPVRWSVVAPPLPRCSSGRIPALSLPLPADGEGITESEGRLDGLDM